jgi:hypothetical protein
VITSYITSQTTRSDFVASFVQFHTRTLQRSGMVDMPLICPPKDQLEAFLNKSLAFEQYILPDFYDTPQGEAEHRESFWKLAKEDRNFCWVDTETLLNGTKRWEEVLGRLKETKIWPAKIATS